jgi:hypothetical protein
VLDVDICSFRVFLGKEIYTPQPIFSSGPRKDFRNDIRSFPSYVLRCDASSLFQLEPIESGSLSLTTDPGPFQYAFALREKSFA